MSEFKKELKAILAGMHQEQIRQGKLLEQLVVVCVESNEQIATIRSRVIEQASRHGQEIHEHEKALIKHDVRLTKIERHLDADFTPDIITDAE